MRRTALSVCFSLAAALTPITGMAAPTAKEKSMVSTIMDSYAEDDLAAFIACRDMKRYQQYMAAMTGAGISFPGVDIIKFQAFARDIERRAELRSKLFWPDRQYLDDNGLANLKEQCDSMIKLATENMDVLNAFVLKR